MKPPSIYAHLWKPLAHIWKLPDCCMYTFTEVLSYMHIYGSASIYVHLWKTPSIYVSFVYVYSRKWLSFVYAHIWNFFHICAFTKVDHFCICTFIEGFHICAFTEATFHAFAFTEATLCICKFCICEYIEVIAYKHIYISHLPYMRIYGSGRLLYMHIYGNDSIYDSLEETGS
jgi:hypothetical protein